MGVVFSKACLSLMLASQRLNRIVGGDAPVIAILLKVVTTACVTAGSTIGLLKASLTGDSSRMMIPNESQVALWSHSEAASMILFDLRDTF